VIANNNIADGSGLESLCRIANNKIEIATQLLKIIDEDFSEEEVALRYDLLTLYDNKKNAKVLSDQI